MFNAGEEGEMVAWWIRQEAPAMFEQLRLLDKQAILNLCRLEPGLMEIADHEDLSGFFDGMLRFFAEVAKEEKAGEPAAAAVQ